MAVVRRRFEAQREREGADAAWWRIAVPLGLPRSADRNEQQAGTGRQRRVGRSASWAATTARHCHRIREHGHNTVAARLDHCPRFSRRHRAAAHHARRRPSPCARALFPLLSAWMSVRGTSPTAMLSPALEVGRPCGRIIVGSRPQSGTLYRSTIDANCSKSRGFAAHCLRFGRKRSLTTKLWTAEGLYSIVREPDPTRLAKCERRSAYRNAWSRLSFGAARPNGPYISACRS